MAMMLVACSSEENATRPDVEEEIDGAVVVLSALENGDLGITRSTLYYAAGSGMKFTWNDGEQVGLYPVTASGVELTPEISSLQIYKITNISANATSSIGHFDQSDKDYSALSAGTLYVAYSQYNGNSENKYNCVKVDYRGQTQKSNELMGLYNTQSDNNAAYLESAKVAGEHLGEKNFLVSSATAKSENGIYLNFSYMGATVRFFLSVESGVVYDQLYVVNNETKFFVAGSMDVKQKKFNDDDKVESHSIGLKLGENGFDLSKVAETSGDTYYASKNSHMIVAYMEVAPINLTTKSILYMKGHTVDSEGNKVADKYYKASLSEKTILAGKAYQWSIAPDSDEPIKFTTIKVQEWVDAMGYDNGDDGNGTQTW